MDMTVSADFDIVHAAELVIVLAFSAGVYVSTTRGIKKHVDHFGEIIEDFGNKLQKIELDQTGHTGRSNLIDERVTAQGKRMDEFFTLMRTEFAELARRFNMIVDRAHAERD